LRAAAAGRTAAAGIRLAGGCAGLTTVAVCRVTGIAGTVAGCLTGVIVHDVLLFNSALVLINAAALAAFFVCTPLLTEQVTRYYTWSVKIFLKAGMKSFWSVLRAAMFAG
jgi:hypothetical protein